MNLRKKIVICCVIAFLALTITIWGLSSLLSMRVNSFVMNLADKMTQEIGHPVQIERVTTKWDWLLLKVNIKNLKVLDKDTNAPLFMAAEIVSTVDTLDSIRCLSLRFKQLLLRNPRLTMQLNAANLPVILGLGESDVTGDVDPEIILKILAMQRRIIVENGDLHLQGLDGADLPFMDLRVEFRHVADNEYTMMARGNIAAAVQPEFVLAVHYYGDLLDYTHAMLDFDLKTSNVQLDDLFNFVPQFRQDIVSGNFIDLDLSGVIQNGTVRQIASDFTINKVNFGTDTLITGGVGHIAYDPINKLSTLQLAKINLSNEALYAQPITIDAASCDVTYNKATSNQIDIRTDNARIKFMDLELQPQLQMQFVNNDLNVVDFSLRPQDAALRRMLVLLPDRILPDGLADWFKRSLIDGEINAVSINYKDQKLRYSLGFKNAELKFSPQWPSVSNIDAALVLDDGKLSVNATKAMIFGAMLKRLDTKYTDYNGKPYSMINIDGQVETTAQVALDYIKQTPLYEGLGAKLETFDPNGAIDLALHLDINAGLPTLKVDVNGAMRLMDASIKLDDLNVPIDNINGMVHFTSTSFSSEMLKLNICDEQATAKIGMHKNKADTLNIAVDLPVKVSALKKALPKLDLSKLQGATRMQADIDLPWGTDNLNRSLTIRSDLVGISVNYPPPFNKSMQSKLPLNLQYSMVNKGQDKLQFTVGSLLNGILFVKDHKLQGGRVAINKKLDNVEPSQTLEINGEIAQLNWEDWAPMLQTTDNSAQLPMEFDLGIKTLGFSGEKYSPVHVKYNTVTGALFLDTALLTGTITANLDTDPKIDVRLERLDVPQKRAKSTAMIDFLRTKREKGKLPVVQFNCKKLNFNKREFRNVHVELTPRNYGYEINSLSINNDHLLLQAQGSWQMDKTATILSGNIFTQNFGKVLGEWGFENSISRGKGEMNFSVNWNGAPMDFDVLQLAGAAHLDLRSGSLTNVNPGIGRIIGLLSLESIQRRLQLDFSDLLSKGFAFDKLMADFKIEPGSITSENIFINSPSAKIEMAGKTGIKSQDLDFTMFVTPKVGASLPIAAAIAVGNPAIGAAIWLFDKASGSKISEITKYKYKVTGTWNSPEVNEVSTQDKVVG